MLAHTCQSHDRNITSERSTYLVPEMTWQPSCSMRCWNSSTLPVFGIALEMNFNHFADNRGVGFAIWRNAFHGILDFMTSFKGMVQSPDPGPASVDDRPIQIEK